MQALEMPVGHLHARLTLGCKAAYFGRTSKSAAGARSLSSACAHTLRRMITLEKTRRLNVRKLLKLAGAVLVLFVASVPVAAAPPCDEVCTCTTKCTQRCIGPGSMLISCGGYGVCLGACRSSDVLPAAHQTAPAEQDDALLARILGQSDCAAAESVPTAE